MTSKFVVGEIVTVLENNHFDAKVLEVLYVQFKPCRYAVQSVNDDLIYNVSEGQLKKKSSITMTPDEIVNLIREERNDRIAMTEQAKKANRGITSVNEVVYGSEAYLLLTILRAIPNTPEYEELNKEEKKLDVFDGWQDQV